MNNLPNNKILAQSKLKAITDNKIKLVKMMIFVLERVENTVGKGENAVYQHFLLFPHCFQKAVSSGLLKVEIVRIRVKELQWLLSQGHTNKGFS